MKTLRKTLIPVLAFLVSFTLNAQIDLDVPNLDKTQTFTMDVIVQGSQCVGIDCSSTESFSFDTQRLKENNLRIHFDDTSNSASFPSNDWRIIINDSGNGGAAYFAIEDATAARVPFRIEAGAPANALYVESDGDIGVGTDAPVVEVHIKDGDTPTLRLEQDGSAGFGSQTWDVAGNETNFFVRDVNNSSSLPFKIRPGADHNSLVIDDDNNIGMGILNATSAVHILKTDANETAIFANNTNATAQDVTLRMGNSNQTWIAQARKNGGFRIRNETNSTQAFRIAFNNDITTEGDITANGVMLTSDERLKKDIRPFTEGLSIVNALNPISYTFNEKSGYLSDRTYYSIRAQELKEVAPYLVHDFTLEKEDKEGNITSADEYLKIDIAAMPWVLVNAVKEQQDQLDEKDAEIDELREEVSELKTALYDLINRLEGGHDITIDSDEHEEFITLSLNEAPFIKQNVPNPYSYETTVDYYIPEGTQNSQIHFYDSQGRLLKKHTLTNRGHGKINLTADQLPSGTYIYSLVIDGKVIASKKMAIE